MQKEELLRHAFWFIDIVRNNICKYHFQDNFYCITFDLIYRRYEE